MKQYLFTFEWTDGNKSANDYIIEWCEENRIRWRYNGYGELTADVFRMNDYVKFEIENVRGDLYGVLVKNT